MSGRKHCADGYESRRQHGHLFLLEAELYMMRYEIVLRRMFTPPLPKV